MVLPPDAVISKKAPKCKVLAICNQKGGVAKTTTCHNLGVSLSMMKKRVLLIDFDIQANLSILFGRKNATSFFEVLQGSSGDLRKAILHVDKKLWLLPSNNKMSLLAKKHIQDENFEYFLRDKLLPIKKYFDYILIDTPPSGDFYTLNTLLTSNTVIIPTPCDVLALNGVEHVINLIRLIETKTSHKIDWRILITMHDAKNLSSKVIWDKLKKQYIGKIFDTTIGLDPKVQESQIVRKPVIHYDQQSRAATQYHRLADEIINS